MKGTLPGWVGTVVAISLALVWHRPTWPAAIENWHVAALFGLLSLGGWLYLYRRYRALADTPTARIGSAAQGYVELYGVGVALEGVPLLSPLTGLPCLWYRVKVEHRNSDGEWRHSHTSQSEACFILEDETGRCVIDPEGASVHASTCDTQTQGDIRTHQWLLLAGMPISAIGEFVTRHPLAERPSVHQEVGETLAAWKADKTSMRFDLDGDGQLDDAEWQLVRAAARRMVEKVRRDAATEAEMHLLQRPRDGRPYLVADRPPEAFATRLKWQTRAVFLIVLSSWGSAIWLFHQP